MIVGQKWLGAEVLRLCLDRGRNVVAVAAPDSADRLHRAAAEAGVHVGLCGRVLAPESVPCGVDVLVAAHAHCFIPAEARARTRLGALGYHPSLLPRHRGRDAVRWAIHMGEWITGGTVYWMTDKADAGPIAAQDWCLVRPGDTPADLWRRDLAPMGLRLFGKVLDDLAAGRVVAIHQDEALATWEPAFKRPSLAGFTPLKPSP